MASKSVKNISRQLVTKMTNYDDVEEFRDTFLLYDKIGDGKVELYDVGDILRALGLNPAQFEIERVLSDVAPTGETRITFEEFAPLYQTLKGKTKSSAFQSEDFADIFRIYDRDNNGMVRVAEVRHLLTSLGEQLKMDEVDILVNGMEDSQGRINYEQFVRDVMNI